MAEELPEGTVTLLFTDCEGSTEAAGLYPVVLEAIDARVVVTAPRLTETVARIAAASGGRWEEAEGHFETALRQAHEIPAVIAQPEVRR